MRTECEPCAYAALTYIVFGYAMPEGAGGMGWGGGGGNSRRHSDQCFSSDIYRIDIYNLHRLDFD